MDDIQSMLERMDTQFSRTKEDGELYAVNRAAGKEAVAVSDETLDIVKLSIKYAEEMDGLYEPTIGPLVDLWAIGEGGERVPDQAAIDAAKSLANYKDIIIDENAKTIKLAREGMVLDMGGIGKGYAADRIADYLKEQGLDSAMINLGGSSIIALGNKPNGSLGISACRTRTRAAAPSWALSKSPMRSLMLPVYMSAILCRMASVTTIFLTRGQVILPRTG